jgi:hypothetical protein
MQTPMFHASTRWFGPLLLLASLLVQTAILARSWQTGIGCQFRQLQVPPNGKPGFSCLLPQQTGIWFTNRLPEQRHLTNQVLPSGSGVAAGDIDGDGWCDLYFCGLNSDNRLYRNLSNWRFEDITDRAGVTCPNLDATGAAFADIDGDTDLDLLVNSIGGGTYVFLNDGKGHYARSPQLLNPAHGGMSLALADADGDGDLDLYVANYRVSTLMDAPGTRFSVRMINGQPLVTMIDGRPPTDPEWTNRFKFKIEIGEGGRGKFAHEELGQPDLFCLNNGKGHFLPVPWTGGTFLDEDGQPLTEPPFDWGLSVMFRDFDRDGTPDLYICNDFRSPDRFWLNNGRGQFSAVPRLALRQTCLSAMGMDVADLNRDGYDDFLVVDMLSRDHRRRMTQRNMMHAEMGTTVQITGRPQFPRNMLFLNRGDGTYAEIAQYAGLEATEWSWAPIFLDVDLDGYEDLLVPNGFERDNMNVDVHNRIKQARVGSKIPAREELMLRRMFPRLTTPNLAFRNRGDLRFEEISQQWGFNSATISQGACLADLDNDGDLDTVVNNMNDVAGLFRNNASAPRVAVRLRGLAPNTRGIGARITVTGGPILQSQEMICGGRYLSSDDTIRVFAAGSLTNQLQIQVAWRSGKRSTVPNALPNCLYEIAETRVSETIDHRPPTTDHRPPTIDHRQLTTDHRQQTQDHGQTANQKSKIKNQKYSALQPFFHDSSSVLAHVHQEESFDDFGRQPLLHKRLSQLGPGICWCDVDGDGWEDLVIGSGKGGQLAWFQNDQKGGFQRINQSPWTTAIVRDQTTILEWKPGMVLVGHANYEDGQATGAAVSAYKVGHGQVEEVVSAWESSAGPMALADYDGDGTLDLFVGGRTIGGKYPVAAASRLYRQQAGKLMLDETNSARLRDVGLVSGAVWSDLDGDGDPDLVLACEWGPIRIYTNRAGTLVPWDAPLVWPAPPPTAQSQPLAPRHSSLIQLTGWWNGVATGDFDGDGQLDIIAANWGQNSKYESHRQKPLRLYYGDLDEDGTVELIESYYEPGLNQYVPNRMLDVVTKAMPFLAEQFLTHQAWAATSIAEALGTRLDRLRFCEANWLESTLFLNRNGRFEVRTLPFEAQLAPAFAACVADFDGDGNEDLFFSQNFFQVEWETSRYDAGRGLWLQGDGQGQFRPVPGQESGVRVYGEQRGAGVGDFDGDGRVDLVVTQNGAETKLFRNVGGKSGLRIRLRGPEGNPRGIGALARLKSGNRFGPAREVHAGSGYWSQDSAVLVMAMPESPSQIWIRWPGGKTSIADIPTGAREIAVGFDGRAEGLR